MLTVSLIVPEAIDGASRCTSYQTSRNALCILLRHCIIRLQVQSPAPEQRKGWPCICLGYGCDPETRRSSKLQSGKYD